MVATARDGGEASCEGTAISSVIVTEMRNVNERDLEWACETAEKGER